MIDRREEILVRLVYLGTLVDGINKVYRNADNISDGARPAIVILDGDESANDEIKQQGHSRFPLTRNIHSLNPEVQILASSTARDIGTILNQLRASYLKLIKTDLLLDDEASLKSLITKNGNVFLDGVSTDFASERGMSGVMTILLEIRFPFDVSELF